jgi:hypothetical protein
MRSRERPPALRYFDTDFRRSGLGERREVGINKSWFGWWSSSLRSYLFCSEALVRVECLYQQGLEGLSEKPLGVHRGIERLTLGYRESVVPTATRSK